MISSNFKTYSFIEYPNLPSVTTNDYNFACKLNSDNLHILNQSGSATPSDPDYLLMALPNSVASMKSLKKY